jgi:hypothetical protein
VSITQELLTFGVGVDTSAAEAGLASLGDATDGVAVGLEDRLSGASAGLKDLGTGSAGASRGISGLGAMISVVDPKLGAMVRQVGSLTRGLQMLRVVSGPLAVAIGVATAALLVYNASQEIAAKRTAEAAERSERLTSSMEAQAEMTRALQRDTDLLSGATDRHRLSLDEQILSQREAGAEARAAIAMQIRALKQQQLEEEKTTESVLAGRAAQIEARAEINSLDRQIAALNRTRQASIDTENENIRQAQRNAKALREQNEATDDSTIAITARAAAIEELTAKQAAAIQKEDALTERQKLSKETLGDLTAEAARIEEEAARSTLTEVESLNAQYAVKIERLQAIQALSLGQVQTEEAVHAVRIAHIEEIGQLEREADEERSKIALAAHDQTLRDMEERKAKNREVASAIADSLGNLASIAETAAKKRADTDKKTAAKMLAVSKTLGIAEVAVNTAVGVSDVIAKHGANPVLAGILSAAVIATGAAQVATIASQSLHQGGQLAPDEQAVRTVVLRDERISSDGRVMSPEATRRMERGEAGQGARVVPVPQFQHFGVFFADMVESGGTPLHDLINQGRDVGRAGY